MAAHTSLRVRTSSATARLHIDGAASRAPNPALTGATDPSVTSVAPPSVRRLLTSERYFGLEARAFREGAERVVARASSIDKRARIDAHTLGQDFRVSPDASWTLLRALVGAGLLRSTTTGAYRPTARLREYAGASLVAPLSRARAKVLIAKACSVAERINTHWSSNAFRVDAVAVSGAYMSRRKHLPELSLWLMVRPRVAVRVQRWVRSPSRSAALREILEAVNQLSSFVVVRIAPNKEAVPRPFSIVFHADDERSPSSLATWGRLRRWSASLGKRRD